MVNQIGLYADKDGFAFYLLEYEQSIISVSEEFYSKKVQVKQIIDVLEKLKYRTNKIVCNDLPDLKTSLNGFGWIIKPYSLDVESKAFKLNNLVESNQIRFNASFSQQLLIELKNYSMGINHRVYALLNGLEGIDRPLLKPDFGIDCYTDLSDFGRVNDFVL